MRILIKLCFLLLIISSQTLYANYKKELQKVEKELKSAQKSKEELKGKEQNILKEIDKIDRQISTSRRNIQKLKADEKKLEQSLKHLSLTIEETEEQIKTKDNLIKDKMVLLYQNNLSASVSSLNEQNEFYLLQVLKTDMGKCAEYKITSDTLSLKEQQEKQRLHALLETRRKMENEQKEIISKRSEKRGLLENIKTQTAEKDKLIKELENSRANIEKLIKGIKTVVMEEFKNMIWPVRAEQPRKNIISKFGTLIDPELGTTLINNGIDIKANYDVPVLAVGNGKVIHEGIFLGYGKIILIDHENGFSTLYAHLAEILVTKGETVQKNEVIGRVGSTGLTTTPMLHFEVRKAGKAVDPLTYLP